MSNRNYEGSATNTLVIAKSNAVVLLSDWSHVYDGTAKAASASTVPPGLNVVLSYDGSPEAPTNAGSYTVVGTIVELNYEGSATNTLVIAKSNAVVLLSDLSHVYDGTAKAASASTVPPGLNVVLSYDGSPEAPTNAGSYTVVGTIVEPNYEGSATNTLVIAKSNAVVLLSDLSHVYDGTAKAASASTVPPGLNVVLSYDGSPEAPTNAGSYTVVGTIVELNYEGSATNTLVIAKSNAVVLLSDLSHVYDGTAKAASASTVPPGLNVVLSYDGSPEAPTNAGSYTVVGTIVEPNYEGSATNTLVIAKSNAVVLLSDLSHVYDGTAKAASASTVPPGLNVVLSYDGSPEAPTNAGSYTVVGTIVELNYEGSATNTLVIAKSNAVVLLSDLSHVYDGTAKAASASTVPPGLNVVLSYDGSPEAPTNAGSYTVVGTIVEPNYEGSATNTLVILPAATPFPITFIGFTNGVVTVTWDSVSNRTYRVQYVTNVSDTNWTDIVPDVTASGPSASQTNAVGTDPRRFYRVLLLP